MRKSIVRKTDAADNRYPTTLLFIFFTRYISYYAMKNRYEASLTKTAMVFLLMVNTGLFFHFSHMIPKKGKTR